MGCHFLTSAKRSGCMILVVSWHSKALISLALDSIGFLDLVDEIYDRDELEKKGTETRCKAIVMQEVLANLGIHGNRAVFADTSKEQLENMPCAKHLVEGKNGMAR